MKVALTFPPVPKVHAWEGQAFVDQVAQLFESSPDRRGHSLVASPDEADVILYLEPNVWKDRSYAELMLGQDWIKRFPGKCFAYNYADFFIGFLPGFYAGLVADRLAEGRFRSWNYLMGLPNPVVEEMAGLREEVEPSMLFSFRGSRSASIRSELIDRAEQYSPFGRITELGQGFFYNLTPELKNVYVEEILQTRFVLCPRGLGVSSHRLFETMVLGRVPVILSDDWVPPTGPDWDRFSVRIAEKDVGRLPEILEPLRERSAEMGRNARRAWDAWFAPEVRIPRFFDGLAELAAAQPETPPDYARLWRSWSFYRPYGLAPEQKLWRNLRDGAVLKKLFRRKSGAS